MTAYVVASLIPAAKQHAPFLAIRAAFSTPELAGAWISATQNAKATSCSVYEVPLDPEPPTVEPPAELAKPCADATGVPA